ncbi:hypothetical protein QYE76_002195 [Lolium multiflorum]|uniref:Retrotransposon gag domain-containing protein n=1 Tax=Lolium multiflorum TaxID=4521 RepID=A0AAD8RN49_LOLMU|nr:hypothetical protein QYE76_002195 [Lolium multiflorum]
MASASDQLRVRCFSQSLTGPAFGWYTSLQPNSVQSWKQLEELFHTQYHSEATGWYCRTSTGLAASFKDLTFQVEYNSLTHLVSRLTLYEQRHPELYQDKFKCAITLVNADEDEDSAKIEVAVAEWTRTRTVSSKWVNPPWPPRGLDFDGLTKVTTSSDIVTRNCISLLEVMSRSEQQDTRMELGRVQGPLRVRLLSSRELLILPEPS